MQRGKQEKGIVPTTQGALRLTIVQVASLISLDGERNPAEEEAGCMSNYTGAASRGRASLALTPAKEGKGKAAVQRPGLPVRVPFWSLLQNFEHHHCCGSLSLAGVANGIVERNPLKRAMEAVSESSTSVGCHPPVFQIIPGAAVCNVPI